MHAVSSHETETGNHWKMADSVIRSGFFVSVAWHEMSRTLVFRISLLRAVDLDLIVIEGSVPGH